MIKINFPRFNFLCFLIIVMIGLFLSSCNLISYIKYSQQEKITYSSGFKHFKYSENQIIIETTFPDSKNRNFLFDLGSPSNIVFLDTTFREMMSEQKPIYSLSKVISADGIRQKRKYYRFGTIKTEQFVLKNSFIVALNRPDPIACTKINGLWGAGLFSPAFKGSKNKVLMILMQDSTISILDTLPPVDNWVPMEAKFNNMSQIIISATIGKEKVDFYFDTGFSGSIVMNSETFKKIKSDSNILEGENITYGYIANTLTGSQYDTAYSCSCRVDFNNGLDADSASVLSTKALSINAIGMEFLSRFNFIVDYQNAKIYFQYNPYFKKQKESLFKLKGFNVKNIIGDKILVFNIKMNSPAEKAGLKVGDQIISINNIKTSDANNCEVIKLFDGIDSVNTNFEIVVIRENELLKFVF